MQAVSPPALLLFQDFLQETKYNFLHIVVCHMVAAIVRLYRLPDTVSKQGKWLATLQKLLVGHIPIPAKCESLLS